MKDDEYIKEMQMLTEQRKAENEKAWNELAIEKQRTKTEKVKRGITKLLVKVISFIIVLIFVTGIATWFISLFLPEAISNAIGSFTKIFK